MATSLVTLLWQVSVAQLVGSGFTTTPCLTGQASNRWTAGSQNRVARFFRPCDPNTPGAGAIVEDQDRANLAKALQILPNQPQIQR